MNRILFVNHRTQQCGVQQAGKRYFDALKHSQRYECHYIDVDSRFEFEYWASELQPAAVIYNFYSGATMPWFSREMVDGNRSRFKQLCIFHELDLSSFGFDLILHQDPTSTDEGFEYQRLPRAIPEYDPPKHRPDWGCPMIGSFGFGLGGKGYSEVVERVQQEFDRAIVRLHIPYAAFGDSDGKGAQDCAKDARSRITRPLDISLFVNHEFLSEEMLLHWLVDNDCNIFPYEENYGRGIASVTDYALAARRPIAITRSHQFKHLWSIDDSFTLEKHSLREIVAMGTEPLEKFHQLWNRETLIAAFEEAFQRVGV